MKKDIQQIIEALIFASDTPLPVGKIREVLDDGTPKKIKEAIAGINKKYEETDSPLQIVEVAGGFQIVTRPEYTTWIARLYRARSASRLTKKALETLAIIAYKQPITKPEIEHIRGVNVDGVVKTLIERNLITVTGREKAPGNPLLYGTTKSFLEYFGLNDLNDLPRLKEIDELLKSDDKFLESLDQVTMAEMIPEELGITSMLKKKEPSLDGGAGQAEKSAGPDESPAPATTAGNDSATRKPEEDNSDDAVE